MIFIFTDNQMLTFCDIFKILLLFLSLSDVVLMEIPVSIHFGTNLMTIFSRIQRFLEHTEVMHITIKTSRFQENNSAERSMDIWSPQLSELVRTFW